MRTWLIKCDGCGQDITDEKVISLVQLSTCLPIEARGLDGSDVVALCGSGRFRVDLELCRACVESSFANMRITIKSNEKKSDNPLSDYAKKHLRLAKKHARRAKKYRS